MGVCRISTSQQLNIHHNQLDVQNVQNENKVEKKQYQLVHEEIVSDIFDFYVMAISGDNKYILLKLTYNQPSSLKCKLYGLTSSNTFENLQTNYRSDDLLTLFAAQFFNNNTQLLLSFQHKDFKQSLNIFIILNCKWSILKTVPLSQYCKFIISHDDKFLYLFEMYQLTVWQVWQDEGKKYQEPQFKKVSNQETLLEFCKTASLRKRGNQISAVSLNYHFYIFQKRNKKWICQRINHSGELFIMYLYFYIVGNDFLVSLKWFIEWNHWKNKTVRRKRRNPELFFSRNHQFSYVIDKQSSTIRVQEIKDSSESLCYNIKISGSPHYISHISENGQTLIIFFGKKMQIYRLMF